MVNLETKHSVLQQLVGKKFTLEKLEEVLFDIGFELDDVEGDDIKIDITPDRLDAISAVGLARILKSYMGLVPEPPTYKAYRSEYTVNVDKSVEGVRPYTACAVITNLKLDDEKLKEIIWIQEKLHATFGKHRRKAAIGIYPLNKITWPISYVGLKPNAILFQPLESTAKMTGADILTKHPTGKEYAHLLEGEDVYPIFIDASDEVLSMPPIINSHTVGKVDVTTTEIFIECSGHDMLALEQLLQNLVCIFADMGGHIHEVTVKYPDLPIKTPKLSGEKRVLKLDDLKSRSGIEVSVEEAAKLLEKMLYTAKPAFDDTVEVTVPPFRTDIWHDVDVIDDIIRAYGVNNLELKLPQLPTTGGMLSANMKVDLMTDFLVGLGLQEVKTLGVTDKDDQFTRMNIKPTPHITLGSTAERSINMVRCWILPELLKFLHHNRSVPYPQKVFEVGDVVLPDDSKDVLSYNQSRMACAVSFDGVTFTDIKQHLEALLIRFDIQATYKVNDTHASFIKGRCADVYVGKTKIGIIGEVSPTVLKKWGFEFPIAVFEITTDFS